MRSLRIALAFFTVLPVGELGPARPGDLSRAAAWLPTVGLLLGGLLAAVAWLTAPLPAGISAALVLGAWLALTGMLHLDGLLDCADALLAPVGQARRLEILRDVHVGSFAVGVGVVALLTRWQCLASLEGVAPLIVAPTVARAVVVMSLAHYPTARAEGLGVAAKGRFAWPGLGAALVVAPLAPAAAVGALVLGLAFTRWAAGKLGGGITGDVHGATIELAETGGLLAAIALAAMQGGPS